MRSTSLVASPVHLVRLINHAVGVATHVVARRLLVEEHSWLVLHGSTCSGRCNVAWHMHHVQRAATDLIGFRVAVSEVSIGVGVELEVLGDPLLVLLQPLLVDGA